jgi:hypothetical protein
MNLNETLRQQKEGFIPIQASAAIQAGGPGSGRHGAEGVLAKHGWSVTKEGTNSTQYKHPDLPGHRIVVNNNSGNWSHNDVHSPDEVDSGKTAKELDDHLIGK